MHRTDATDFDNDIGNGERGFKESPAGNETIVAANFLNAVQEEIAKVIEDAGLVLRTTGNDDAVNFWGQLSPAIQIHIATAIAGLNSDDIANNSIVGGTNVTQALNNLEALTDDNSSNLGQHIASAAAHLASKLDNDSSVVGAKISDALNTLLSAVNINTSNIGSNAVGINANSSQISVNSASISTNAGNIAANTAALAALNRREWKTTMASLGVGSSISQHDAVLGTVITGHGWTDIGNDDIITVYRRGLVSTLNWGRVVNPADQLITMSAMKFSATELKFLIANPSNVTWSGFGAFEVTVRIEKPQ